MDIHDYPLIAVTEVFDMPSVDNTKYDYGTRELTHGTCHDIMRSKLNEVFDRYDWKPDEKFRRPIWLFESERVYTTTGTAKDKTTMIGNGHHRLAFQALVQGALFVHYSTNPDDAS